MLIEFNDNHDCNYTEIPEYGVMHKYNVINSSDNINYVLRNDWSWL